MTDMKKLINAIGVLLLAGLLSFPVTAGAQGAATGKDTAKMTEMERDKGHMNPMKNKTMNLTAEQQAQIEKLHKQFRVDNADTIKQLMIKRFDLYTILNSDVPDVDKAKAAQKEISDLKGKLEQKKIELYFELRKINPDAKFGHEFGKGHGMRGMKGHETGN